MLSPAPFSALVSQARAVDARSGNVTVAAQCARQHLLAQFCCLALVSVSGRYSYSFPLYVSSCATNSLDLGSLSVTLDASPPTRSRYLENAN